MFANLGFADDYARIRAEELLREAELYRLASLASGPGRPWRVRVAGWLKATAEWIDEPTPVSVASAEA